MQIKIHRITADVICLYLIFLLLPLYVFKSGNLQPVDVVILFLFLYYSAKGSFTRIYFGQDESVFGLIIFLLLFQLFILSLHAIFSDVSGTWILIFYALYYIGLLLVFTLMFQNLYSRYSLQKAYNILLNGLIIAFIIPMGKLLLFGNSRIRETFSFNDPNQLVFFSLTSLSILYYATLQVEDCGVNKSKLKSLVILGLNSVVLMLSVSRTALVLVILYIATVFRVFNLKYILRDKWIRGAVIFLVGGLLLYCAYLKFYVYISMIRPNSLSMSVIKNDFFIRAFSGWQIQNYDVWRFLVGTGTAINYENREFHDNFVGIFYQTGVVSLLLYIIFCGKLLLSSVKKKVSYSLPIIMYILVSLSLYAFRTRFWWLLLAFIISVIKLDVGSGSKIKNRSYGNESYIDK